MRPIVETDLAETGQCRIPASIGDVMELRQLQYFLTLAETLNFTRAAEQLHVSQSTLSEQIRAMEHELGGQLFIRDSRHVELSLAGQQMLVPAERAVAAAREAAKQARVALSTPSRGFLRIGVVGEAQPPVVAMLLRSLRLAYPEIGVNLHSVDLVGYEADLENGVVDALLAWLPLSEEIFEWDALLYETPYIAMRWDNPLAEAEILPLADVLEQPMPSVSTAVPALLIDHVLMRDFRNGASPHLLGEPVLTPAEVGWRVLTHNVVAPCPETVARHYGPAQLIQFRPLADWHPVCRFVLAWRRGKLTSTLMNLREQAAWLIGGDNLLSLRLPRLTSEHLHDERPAGWPFYA